MATTSRLNITLLTSGQEKKEITINDALNILDTKAFNIMGTYSTAGLPAANANDNTLAMVNDINGSELWLAYSDGTNWRKLIAVDNTIIV